MLTDSAQAILQGNKILRNGKYGLALFEVPRFSIYRQFTGYVNGKKNIIPDSDEPDRNKEGAFCPDVLFFLTSKQGGELDRREQQ